MPHAHALSERKAYDLSEARDCPARVDRTMPLPYAFIGSLLLRKQAIKLLTAMGSELAETARSRPWAMW